MISEAVFDTNVIVSGILFPESVPGKVVDAILEGHCRPIVSDGILAEYADVLSRPKFKLAPERVNYILDAFRSVGIPVSFALSKHRTQFPDEDDVIFVEAALSLSSILVTGNKRHYPPSLMQGVCVMSPVDFLYS
ncbi:MAG: putative toxin-antitoxin system toxin component, PIN family [Kiritimatiellia bacterium]